MPASRYLNLIWRCGDGKSQRWDKEGLSIWMEQSCKAKQNNDDYATITVMNCAFRAACKICESATAAHIIIIRPLFDVIMPWFDGCIFQAERTHQFSQPTLKFDPLNIIAKTINTTLLQDDAFKKSDVKTSCQRRQKLILATFFPVQSIGGQVYLPSIHFRALFFMAIFSLAHTKNQAYFTKKSFFYTFIPPSLWTVGLNKKSGLKHSWDFSCSKTITDRVQ